MTETRSWQERLRAHDDIMRKALPSVGETLSLSKVADYIDALIKPMQWQSMKKAPKDGRTILVYDGCISEEIQMVFWNDILNYWQPLNDDAEQPNPTHWMPLPSPPSDNSEAQAGGIGIK